jgi:hypothetical protein
VLGVYRHREKFTIDAFHLPASIAALVAEWGLGALDQHVMSVPGFKVAYSAFYQELKTGTLPAGILKPPVYPAPALLAGDAADDDGDFGSVQTGPMPEYTRALAAFWASVAAHPDFAVVGKAAIRALAIPFSQTAVERAFSTLKNLATQNRLHAGERYLTNLLMLVCNRPYYKDHSNHELEMLGLADMLKSFRV